MEQKNDKPPILVVEDEEELAGILSKELTDAGYRPVTVHRVPDARTKLTNQEFGAILLDIRLGEATGDQVVNFIRGDRTNLNYFTPVLVISAHLDAEIVKKLAPSIQGAFVKPVNHEELISRVKMLCPV